MNLMDRVHALRRDEPRLRARELAGRLGVSELEVLTTHPSGELTRLRPDWDALLDGLPALGRVLALTRNETAVHEQRGVYRRPEGRGPVRALFGEGIELRLFLSAWASAWAHGEDGRHSVQIFDAHGDAVHKIHAVEGTDREALAALVRALASEEPAPSITPRPARVLRADDEIDVAAFQEGWRALTDTHGFFPLLRRHGVDRLQAMRLAPAGMVTPLPVLALQETLQACADARLPLMVFVSNPGCVQIHSGLIRRVVPMEAWINVLDPDFNLHVRRDRLASCWRVVKPTLLGPVLSLELYDTDGALAVQLFGQREGEAPQAPEWAGLLGQLAPAVEAAA